MGWKWRILLAGTLLVLKLTNVIGWSWLWVTSPLWFTIWAPLLFVSFKYLGFSMISNIFQAVGMGSAYWFIRFLFGKDNDNSWW